ncbi:MAG: transporter [Thermoleophilia bacterium]|nr:transporter [Thermoleophilia bacterium]
MRALRRTHRSSTASPTPAWRRDVRLLAASRGISMAGAEAGYIAMMALAWHLTGSASQASLVLLASVVARIVGSPLAGWIGDRFDRRTVIIVGEVVVAVALLGMAMATTMWQLMLATGVVSLAATAIGAALDAALPNLVPAKDLATANATMGMARTAGHMLGPVLGGLLVAGFGARTAFLLDSASSIVAALLVLGIVGSTGGAADGADGDAADGVRFRPLDGLTVIASDPVLRLLVAGWFGMCICFAFVTAAELPLAVEFGMDEAGLGAIVSCWCFGALVGSWLARRVDVANRGVSMLIINAGISAVVFAGAGLVPSFVGVLALMAIGGCSMALAEVVESTLIQQRIPDAVRARALAAYGAVMSAVWGTNLAFAGLLVEATSARTTYVFAGAWCLVGVAGFAALARHLRRDQLRATLRILRPRHALESELAEGA